MSDQADNEGRGFDPLAWIVSELKPNSCSSDQFIYDLIASQSGECLAGIYQQFDPDNPYHYSDRAAALDFLVTGGNGHILDFGPGDGWPSLIIAPYVSRVTGVDSSARRVEVCAVNAQRMGIGNAEFVRVGSDGSLPFNDGCFDAVVAATSIEQAPDPQSTLRELHRVLKPGGKLRMNYESLGRYRGGREREAWMLMERDSGVHLVVYSRNIEGELVDQYRLTLDSGGAKVLREAAGPEEDLTCSSLTEELLSHLRHHITEAVYCLTYHPSGTTWARWLANAGFSTVKPTRFGGHAGRRLFESLAPDNRPQSLGQLDELLIPLVREVAAESVPLTEDPPLTAVKNLQ